MKSCNGGREIKAIFFDLDNTLYDYNSSSEYSKNKVFSYLLNRYPHLKQEDILSSYEKIIQEAVEEEVKGIYDAWDRQKRFSKLLLSLGLKDDELSKKLVTIFAEARAESSKPYPEAHDVLSKLREKYVLGIITNGPSVYQREEISLLKLESYFSHILIAEEVGFRKPAKEIFQMALKKVACHPEEAVMVGNNPREDIKTAKKLGMGTVLLDPKNRFAKEDLVLEERPDYLIRKFAELLELY
ncbi:MAG: HAD family hydrolase [Candidatus Heimdallarchaeota archaeon]